MHPEGGGPAPCASTAPCCPPGVLPCHLDAGDRPAEGGAVFLFPDLLSGDSSLSSSELDLKASEAFLKVCIKYTENNIGLYLISYSLIKEVLSRNCLQEEIQSYS